MRRSGDRITAVMATLPIPRLAIAFTITIGILYAAAQALGIAPEAFDAKAYWLASQADPYARSTVGQGYAYLYSPAFIQAFAPFQLLPWPVFTAVWTLLIFGAFLWAAGPWALPLLAIVTVPSSISIGNLEFFLAAAIVAGFRWPGAWALPLLTKPTMGIGLLWFAVRREWRSLLIALGISALIAAVSFVAAPNLWFQWRDVLIANQNPTIDIWQLPGPLAVRVLIAAAIVVWGARTDRAWTVPVAAAIALPVARGAIWTIMAVGVFGALRRDSQSLITRLEGRLMLRDERGRGIKGHPMATPIGPQPTSVLTSER